MNYREHLLYTKRITQKRLKKLYTEIQLQKKCLKELKRLIKEDIENEVRNDT